MKTYSETVALLNEIVAEKPEGYKYTDDPKTFERQAQYSKDDASATGCYYAHADGSPGCIVGTFIHKLKPEFELRDIEFMNVASALSRAGISVSNDSVLLLSDAQACQDRGGTWSEAVSTARSANVAERYFV